MDINVTGQDINGGFWSEMQKMIEDQTVYTPEMAEGIKRIAKEQKKVADQYEADE